MKRDSITFIIIFLVLLILLYYFTRNRGTTEGYEDGGGLFGKKASIDDIVKRETAVLSKKFSAAKNIKARGNVDKYPSAGKYNFLINYNILAQKDGGYLGEFADGAFSEATAVKYATAFGARMIILNINDYDGIPKLIARDTAGIKVSNGEGSVKEALLAIREQAYTDIIEGRPNPMKGLPMILYLRFGERNYKWAKKISSKCAENMATYLSLIKDVVLTSNSESSAYSMINMKPYFQHTLN